jgi:hypothetical protein
MKTGMPPLTGSLTRYRLPGTDRVNALNARQNRQPKMALHPERF